MEDPDPVTNSKTDSTSKIDLVTVLHSQPNPKNNSQDKSSTSTSKEKNSNTVLSPPLNSSWSHSSTTSGWSKSFTTSKSSTSGWERYVTKMNNTTSSSSPNKDKCWVRENTELKQSILHKSVHHNSPTEHNHQKYVTFEFSRRNLISNTNQATHSSHRSNQQVSNYSQQNNNKVKKNTTTHSISMNKHNMTDTEKRP